MSKIGKIVPGSLRRSIVSHLHSAQQSASAQMFYNYEQPRKENVATADFHEIKQHRDDREAVIFAKKDEGLSENLLKSLILGDAAAVVVPGFCAPETCELLSDALINSTNVEKYDHEIYEKDEKNAKPKAKLMYYGVDRVGEPFNKLFSSESLSKSEKERQRLFDHYYTSALKAMRYIRKTCGTLISPVDKLRVELDDCWPHGAEIARLESNNNRRMFVGIGRIMRSELSYQSEVQPHFDMLPPNFLPLEGQFSANVYVKVPPSGGSLQVWDVPALSAHEIANSPHDKDWRAVLPKPIEITPKKGDLILVNTRKPHAITAFDEGVRVSIQTFIGYMKNKPLKLWN